MPAPLRAGITLMELLLVIVLVAGLAAVSAYGLGIIGQADTRGEALRLSSIIRYVYNEAVTQNRTLQLVIDLDDGSLRVDELNVNGGISDDELRGTSLAMERGEEEDTFEKFRENDGSPLDEEDEEFVALQRSEHDGPMIDEEDRQLKEGVFFLGVMTSHHEQLQTEGVATINFFPSGFVERTIIYVGNEEAKSSEDLEEGGAYTLLVNPLTGQSTIKPGRVPIEEKFFEEEEAD